MKALLDTHAFLWWITDFSRLSKKAFEYISNGNNELYLSSVSCWELAIKENLGRIELPDRIEMLIADELRINSIKPLFISINHALNITNLPNLHRDPFDRMLISQAQIEGLSIVSRDAVIPKYDVEVIW